MTTKFSFALGLALLTTAASAIAADAGSAAKAKPAAAPAAAAPAAGAPAAAEAPPVMAKIDWKAMDKKARKAYMKKTVMPAAKKLFVAFDAKKYKKMDCMTCHGSGASKDFKMPNPELPKLPTSQPGFMALNEKKPEMMKFMGTKVKPHMAALLGMQEWTPEHQDGFGCYGCHTKEEAAAAPAAPAPAAPAPAKPAAPAPAKPAAPSPTK